jgi:peptidyl-Lys metalloendopeptidase
LRTRIAKLLGAAALLAATPPVSNAGGVSPNAIECRLHVPPRVTAGAPVPLTFELVSHAPLRLRVLTWNTPLEGWFGRYLRVTHDGREVQYQGPQMKRGAPDPHDYVALLPGRTIRGKVDLRDVYELSHPGRYRVAFDGWLHDVTAGPPRTQRTPLSLACPAAEFELAG